jgi:hypothetical protein
MSMLASVRAWLTKRQQHEREEYADKRGFATDEELEGVKQKHRWSAAVTEGMPEGTGTSPTGTPIDFTADQKPPRY